MLSSAEFTKLMKGSFQSFATQVCCVIYIPFTIQPTYAVSGLAQC